MKTTIIGLIAFASFSVWADINKDLNKIKSRIPEAGIVSYEGVNNLRFGEREITNADYSAPTEGNHLIKMEVLCVSKVSQAEIQQSYNWGKRYLTANTVIAIDGVLFTCTSSK